MKMQRQRGEEAQLTELEPDQTAVAVERQLADAPLSHKDKQPPAL